MPAYGMITDLRNDLYDAVLRRSVAFFQKHTTGTLLSTMINDIERVQFAMSSVLGEFLQQIFHAFYLRPESWLLLGRRLAWVLLLFVPVIIFSAAKLARGCARRPGRGQDKLAEIQNILHETITGNRIVKAFGMECWEMNRFRRAAQRLFQANLRSVSACSDQFAADGCFWRRLQSRCCCCWGASRIAHRQMTAGSFITFLVAVFTLYDPVRKFALFYNSFQQALGASEEIFKFMDAEDDVQEKKRAFVLKGFNEGIRFENVGFAYERTAR